MAFEPPSKSQNNYIFIYFGMTLKMDDINVFFIFIFIQIDISHKYKLHMQFANHFVVVYAITNHFCQVPWRIVVSKVTKMVYLDRSCKHMGWNG